MDRYKKGDDRGQLSMVPMCLDDMIPADAEVRGLEVIVEKMDVRSLGFTHHETKQTGRMPYDPADMFKLYAYSYFNGIRSSRKIERECYRNIELMWLIGNIKPDFKTIADFRRDNKEQIKAAFQKFSMICSELGLIGKEMVAVDGSKFRASNSRLAYHSEKKIDEKIKHHAEKAKQYMKLLDACDKEEDIQPKLTREEIIEKIDKVNNRLAELAILKEEVVQNGTIYETDPDSRMMKTNNNGVDICHNVQIAVDDKNHLVVAVDVTSQAIDKEQLHNMALQAKENMEVDTMTVIADKGICPQGYLLLPYKTRAASKLKGHIRYANAEACTSCIVKDKCTTGKCRTIKDRPLQEYAREVDNRTAANISMYHQRKQLVEHPFGTVKRAMGFSYFLTRGNENVRTESLLHFLAYNFKRVINLAGTKELVAVLQA